MGDHRGVLIGVVTVRAVPATTAVTARRQRVERCHVVGAGVSSAVSTIDSGAIIEVAGATVVGRPWWHLYAACIGRMQLMYSPDHLDQQIALQVCAGCGVRELCLAEALDEERDGHGRWCFGVRGGLSGTERRELLHAVRRTAQSVTVSRE